MQDTIVTCPKCGGKEFTIADIRVNRSTHAWDQRSRLPPQYQCACGLTFTRTATVGVIKPPAR